MSTNNFYFRKCLQVVQTGDDDFAFDDAILNAKTELAAAFPKGYAVDEYEKDENGGIRSYPGKVIFRIPVPFFFVDVVIRNGYYADANIDWTVRLDGTEFDVSGDEYAKVEAKAYAVGERVTEVLKQFTTTLEKVADMSNGEAIYKVKK